jgi:large subunit ribosomal protein L15
MKLHHLRPAEGAVRPRRRVGRGKAAGQGKTAGRGTKGLLARHNPKLGFEGGQMPMQRRIPHLKGFTNPNRVEFAVVNVSRLEEAFEPRAEVNPEVLHQRRMVRKGMPVKVLGQGELGKALTVRAHAVSASARAKIEQAGGTVHIISL